MKYLLVIMTLLSLFLLVPAQANTKIGDLEFTSSLDSLMASAQQSQKLIIIDWFTDW
jgi:hypothetical protein